MFELALGEKLEKVLLMLRRLRIDESFQNDQIIRCMAASVALSSKQISSKPIDGCVKNVKFLVTLW